MKKCSYCGGENDDSAVACSGCGTAFESPAPSPDPRATDPARALVIVKSFGTMAEASLLVTRLEAAGIEACIPEEYASQVFSHVIPLGSVTVRVACEDLAAAKAIADHWEQTEITIMGEDAATAVEELKEAAGPERKRNKLVPYILAVAVIAACVGILATGYRRTEARMLLRKGNEFLHSGDWDQAIGEFNRAIRLNPRYATAYYDRAYAYGRKRDNDKEILDLNEAIRLNPQNAKAYVNRGRAFRIKGELEKALADLDTAIRLAPERPSGWANRAYVFTVKKDFGKAISDLNEAIGLDPTDPIAYANRAYAYEQEGEWDKAISDFTELIHLSPTNAWSYGGRGAAYTRKANWDMAIRDFDAVLRLAPNNAFAYRNRAWARSKMGEYAQALSDYREAVHFGRTNAGAYNSLAWFLATCPSPALRDGKQAVELATKACELSDWKSWFCVGTLGAANAEAGDFEKAIKYQQQAIAMTGLTDKDRREAEQQLLLYERHQAYHEAPKADSENRALSPERGEP